VYKNKKFLALIPARSGSKRLKDKNILLLRGKPLIAYTIESAIKSGVFDKIIVSTDSSKIAEIAGKYGAEVPFIRPKELATDETSAVDVILHALQFLNNRGEKYDYFALLQPTSPLRTAEDILNAVNLLFEKNANSVVSVCEIEHSPLWMNTLPNDLSLEGFIREKRKRRQDLPRFYRLNGAIYLASVGYFLREKDWFKEKSYAYIMPRERSVDIDDYVDFKLAEVLIEELK